MRSDQGRNPAHRIVPSAEPNEMDDLRLNLAVLLLLGIANGMPIFVTALLKDRFSTPLDCGLIRLIKVKW